MSRMKVDIFPALNPPVIYVCQPYGGLDPDQMEGLLTNYYEFHFLYVAGIKSVESENVQGMALMKLTSTPAPTWPSRWPRRSRPSTGPGT